MKGTVNKVTLSNIINNNQLTIYLFIYLIIDLFIYLFTHLLIYLLTY